MDQRATIRKACIAFVLLSSIALLSACGKAVASAAGNQKAQGNDIVIHKSDVTDVATFIPYEAGNVKMEIIAVKAPDGSIRTAFNTCQVCFDSGKGYYVQEGDELVCQNCGNRFDISKVEKQKSGCNPVPIMETDKKDDGTTITISADYINQNKDLFAKWKTK
jgi:uncharacterized membrane protein